MALAPKRRPNARRMDPEAKAEIGLERTCDECNDIKIVSEATFALHKQGFRGWHTTCRTCQSSYRKAPHISPSARRASTAKKLYDSDMELIFKLYGMSPDRDRKALDEVIAELTTRLADLPDRQSFGLFVRILSPLIADWSDPGAIHDDIIDGLLSSHRRRLIIATRYSAKSTLTAMWVAWKLHKDPLIKILVLSRGSNLAKRMLRTVRQVFIANCPVLEHIKPTDECVDSAEQFQTPQTLKQTVGGASFTSLGITSNIVGLRSDITICDDVEGPQEDSPEKVVDLKETLNEVHMINPKGEKVFLGTFQSEFSVYAVMADEVDNEGNRVWEFHRALMFEEEDGEIRSRWPARFSDQDAKDWRRAVTLRAWRLHALLIADPSILHERPLKIGDLIVIEHSARSLEFPVHVTAGGPKISEMSTWGAPPGDVWYGPGSVSPDMVPYSETVVAVDPASGLAGRDAIGVAVLGVTQSGLGVIRHIEGVRGKTKEANLMRVACIIRDYRATCLVVEETEESLFGSTLEGYLVRVSYPMVVEKATSGGQKKGQRIIDALAPPMGAGRICILRSVAESDHGADLVNQMVRVTYDGRTGKAREHDDSVDALAHAVAKAKLALISDVAENLAERRIEYLDKLRYVPSRYGGLGGQEAPGRSDGFSQMSMGELLIEEDETTIRLIERRDRLQDAVNITVRQGRDPDGQMIQRITGLTRQIRELQTTSIL